MEKRLGCTVEPYLSGDVSNIYDYEIDEEFKVEKTSNLTNSENEVSNDPDYTIEKFIFYDDFVKKLQVLNIIHSACMNCKELLEVC